jgi:UDP-N-acetylmuramoyl-tripeptide--D-alanyl-D-alanine ligase
MIHAVLSTRWNTLKNIKNYNNEIGVPFTLLGLESGHEAAVIEMGMNHSGELTRLAAMTRPTIGLITNVGEGHLEFLGSVENVAHAKAEMMSGMAPGSTILLNRETECLDILREHASERVWWSNLRALQPGADYAPESYSLDAGSCSFVLRGVECVLPLYGVHNLFNAVAAMAIAIELGLDAGQAAAALASFENVDKRSQRIEREFVLFNDTYNSNPLSLRKALESVSAVYPDRRKIAVLADMKELGEASEYYHRQAGHEVFENGFTLLYTWGEMAGWMAAGARAAGMAASAVRHFDDKSALTADVRHECAAGDVLLIKGSRSMKMEEVAEELLR